MNLLVLVVKMKPGQLQKSPIGYPYVRGLSACRLGLSFAKYSMSTYHGNDVDDCQHDDKYCNLDCSIVKVRWQFDG